MANNNHTRTVCGDEELLVSYLYDEIESADKSRFEEHLRACSFCAGEVSALRGVQFSVAEWKRTELSAETTPFVTIPRETRETDAGGRISAAPANALERLRALFVFNPARLAAGGLALALAFFAVIVLLVLNRAGGEANVAGGGQRETVVRPLPTASAARTETDRTDAATSASSPEPSANHKSAPKIDAVEARQPSNAAGGNRALKTEKIKAGTPKSKLSPAIDKKKAPRPAAPVLSNIEDDEEESLQLADLFAEIDTEE